jgi:hypothetical protein
MPPRAFPCVSAPVRTHQPTRAFAVSLAPLRPRARRAVAYGVLRAEALPAALQLASGAVQPVARSADGELFIGTARLTAANIPAANGVVHVLDGVLAGDMAVNTSAIGVAERLGDFGPFNISQVRVP